MSSSEFCPPVEPSQDLPQVGGGGGGRGRGPSTSTKEKNFVCPEPGCGKRFALASYLKQHAVCHSDARPFVCSYCGQGYARKYQLQVHVRGNHTNERPYVCREPGCGRRFVTASSALDHARRVHRETPEFKCDLCEKCFFTPTSLRSHRCAGKENVLLSAVAKRSLKAEEKAADSSVVPHKRNKSGSNTTTSNRSDESMPPKKRRSLNATTKTNHSTTPDTPVPPDASIVKGAVRTVKEVAGGHSSSPSLPPPPLQKENYPPPPRVEMNTLMCPTPSPIPMKPYLRRDSSLSSSSSFPSSSSSSAAVAMPGGFLACREGGPSPPPPHGSSSTSMQPLINYVMVPGNVVSFPPPPPPLPSSSSSSMPLPAGADGKGNAFHGYVYPMDLSKMPFLSIPANNWMPQLQRPQIAPSAILNRTNSVSLNNNKGTQIVPPLGNYDQEEEEEEEEDKKKKQYSDVLLLGNSTSAFVPVSTITNIQK